MNKHSISIEYPLYNVCYQMAGGVVKTVKERVGLKEGIQALKKFDRMICCQGKAVEDVTSIYLQPVRV